jgi:hypothetical protein
MSAREAPRSSRYGEEALNQEWRQRDARKWDEYFLSISSKVSQQRENIKEYDSKRSEIVLKQYKDKL